MNDATPHKRGTDNHARLHTRRTDTGVRGWLTRNLGWLSYLLLALAIAYSLNTVRMEGSERRNEIIAATQRVIRDSCERGNSQRIILRDLISQGNTTARQYRDEGLLTQAQYERAVENNREAVARLKDVDCEKAVSRVSDQGIKEESS